MVGLTKERVLACMGPPANRAAVGSAEVWSYSSEGENFTSYSYGRRCTVKLTMTNGRVTAINYTGPNGGVLSPNEQCAFAVANCAQSQ